MGVNSRPDPAMGSRRLIRYPARSRWFIAYSMLIWCWASVVDAGPTINQHWNNVTCLLGISSSLSIFVGKAINSRGVRCPLVSLAFLHIYLLLSPESENKNSVFLLMSSQENVVFLAAVNQEKVISFDWVMMLLKALWVTIFCHMPVIWVYVR